jgi:hypothetical protein
MNDLARASALALLVAGCSNDRPPAPVPSPPPASTPQPALAAGTPAPPGGGAADDLFERYLAYAEESAPSLARARAIAADPQLNGDPARLVAALRSDEVMRDYPRDSQRMLRQYRLTVDDLQALAPALAESGSVLAEQAAGDGAGAGAPARAALVGRFGTSRVASLERGAARVRSIRALIDTSTRRPIDCGRQPDSCSCTDCPVGCKLAGHEDCSFACVADAARCAIENAGLGSVLCAIPFQRCMDRCDALPCE